jgi:hypothetical protein
VDASGWEPGIFCPLLQIFAKIIIFEKIGNVPNINIRN